MKAGQLPLGWDKNPDQLQQKDLDARWVKKNGINYYGYKNGICIDKEHGFIRCYAVTPANMDDSQMFLRLLDPENQQNFVWADSADSWARLQDLLELAGFDNLINAKGSRNHPLSEEVKAHNRIKSSIRTTVEHVFGYITMSMGGKLTRTVDLPRTEALWGLRNLTYNFLRYLQRSDYVVATAWWWYRHAVKMGWIFTILMIWYWFLRQWSEWSCPSVTCIADISRCP